MNGMSQIKSGKKERILRQFHIQNSYKHSLVEVCGCERIMLENHKGVIEYSNERICVKVSYGCVKICGHKLTLAQMSADQLVVMGQIYSISFVRRGA